MAKMAVNAANAMLSTRGVQYSVRLAAPFMVASQVRASHVRTTRPSSVSMSWASKPDARDVERRPGRHQVQRAAGEGAEVDVERHQRAGPGEAVAQPRQDHRPHARLGGRQLDQDLVGGEGRRVAGDQLGQLRVGWQLLVGGRPGDPGQVPELRPSRQLARQRRGHVDRVGRLQRVDQLQLGQVGRPHPQRQVGLAAGQVEVLHGGQHLERAIRGGGGPASRRRGPGSRAPRGAAP